jgi:RimJ/RimL family protein N-acetyltransferase
MTLAGDLEMAQAAEAVVDFVKAFACLQRAQTHLQATAEPFARERSIVQKGLWRLSPLWWADLHHGGLGLRRCRRGDADFFRQCFADDAFRAQFNRQQPWRGDLGNALENSGRSIPAQSTLLMWVVQSRGGTPLGLASLSSIDPHNHKTEFSVGFTGTVPLTYGIKATMLVLHFALFLMCFNKVYAYIYEDNPQALHNALRLGFEHEGLLKDHFRLPDVGFVNVNLVALTRTQLQDKAPLRALAKRLISQDW